MDEVEYWKAQVQTRNRERLTTVTRAATAWSGVFAGLLTLFAAVTFAGGLTPVDALPGPWAGVVRTLTVLALLAALASTVLTGRASGAALSTTNDSTWDGQRDWVAGQAATAYARLRLGRALGLAAVGLVALLTVVAVVARPGAAVPTVVVVVDGTARCGELQRQGDALTVGGTALTRVSSLTVVDGCP